MRRNRKLIWTGIVVFFIGGVIWTAVTEKPKAVEPDPCAGVRAQASPVSTRLRVLPGTSEQQYLECARKLDHILVMADRIEREENGSTKENIDKFGRKPISEEELIRLSKMTQDERDREDCQKFNEFWERLFKKPYKESSPTDPTDIKLHKETLDWCEKFH